MRVLVLALLIAALVSCARADDDPRPGRGGGPNIRRQLEIDTNNHEVKIEARSNTAGVVTRYEFEFKTDGVCRWRSRFFQRTNDTTTMYGFKVEILKIVEFNDTGSTAGQFDTSDAVTNTIRLSQGSSNNWNNIKTWQSLGSDGVSKVYSWNTRRTLPSNGFLNITFRTAESLVTDLQSGGEVSPKSIKFDVDLENYRFQSVCDSVAIVIAIKSRDGRRVASLDSSTGAVPVGNQGGFVWTRDITRGINNATLIPSSLAVSSLITPAAGEADDNDDDSDETAQLLYFSIPAGNISAGLYLRWDPLFSVDTTSSAGSVAASLATLLIALFVAVCGSMSL